MHYDPSAKVDGAMKLEATDKGIFDITYKEVNDLLGPVGLILAKGVNATVSHGRRTHNV